eukprot:1159783-Pelagomonas_calceolata.AAC.16
MFPAQTAEDGDIEAFLRVPRTLWGMVTLKPWKSVCSWKAARKRDMSSTSRGTYTPSKPTCWNAVLWSSGEREWDTGLPMMPKTLVAAVWPCAAHAKCLRLIQLNV